MLDIVAAWSVDRLGRSLQDLIGFLGELNGAGCDLYLERQAVDTTTPAGRALFQMLGVFAEFERSIITERTIAGIARARMCGTKSGKAIGRPKVGPKIENAIRASLSRGVGILKTAREVATIRHRPLPDINILLPGTGGLRGQSGQKPSNRRASILV